MIVAVCLAMAWARGRIASLWYILCRRDQGALRDMFSATEVATSSRARAGQTGVVGGEGSDVARGCGRRWGSDHQSSGSW